MSRPAFSRDMADGPGLFEITGHDGPRHITNMRRLAGTGRQPGSVLIGAAAWLLALIGGGALYVSYTAQQQYIFTVRHQNAASIIEALLLDLMMIVFTMLALGLARAGKPARTERTLILVCGAASAAMNAAHADLHSPRSVTAWMLAPVALAIVVDRVVAVIRRHVLADEEPSAWAALGTGVTAAARLAGLVVLYTLRFTLAAPSTAKGVRRAVIDAAPLPGQPRRAAVTTPEPQAITQALTEELGSVRDLLRTELASVRETMRTELASVHASAGDGENAAAPLVDRDALIAGLADEIRDAISGGAQWLPDYEALMRRTGRRRSWCEKAVREARTQAFTTPYDPRTADEPDPYTGTPDDNQPDQEGHQP
jgi:hypothetical protein